MCVFFCVCGPDEDLHTLAPVPLAEPYPTDRLRKSSPPPPPVRVRLGRPRGHGDVLRQAGRWASSHSLVS